MKRSTLLCAEIEYDDALMDAVEIAAQLSKCCGSKNLRGATIGRFLALEQGRRLALADACAPANAMNPPGSVTVEIIRTPFGVDLLALNAFGERFAAVSMDYFDNRIRALAWEAFDDEPVSAHVVCEDVRNAVNTRLGSVVPACGDSSGLATGEVS